MLTITDNGTIEKTQKKLETIKDKRLASWVSYAIGKESDTLVDNIKYSWLSGQAVDVVTGELRASMGAWRSKRKGKDNKIVYIVRPGVHGLHSSLPIPGMLNYVAKWAGTKHEFLKPAFRSFGGNKRISTAIQKNLDKMAKEVNKE